MRIIAYQRHEHTFPEPENRNAPLYVFVYDVPYLGVSGVFPPLHLLNELFMTGGSQGGMSPGATWEPFAISQDEFSELVSVLTHLEPKTLGTDARFTLVKFVFDPEFDHIRDRSAWASLVSTKHRESFFSKQQEAANRQ
ncbi:hypothetical protein [Azovibrio restrictus]|uniref:hypothetical protein n=1 Tax=Azovibrio restrictus TaxID=146938 RepID=UPI0026ED2BEA|nr:hypothetical protein [Azovibrio restrictus]MDD3483092.1 hypothetical protein [Azovibrio restrictus]